MRRYAHSSGRNVHEDILFLIFNQELLAHECCILVPR